MPEELFERSRLSAIAYYARQNHVDRNIGALREVTASRCLGQEVEGERFENRNYAERVFFEIITLEIVNINKVGGV